MTAANSFPPGASPTFCGRTSQAVSSLDKGISTHWCLWPWFISAFVTLTLLDDSDTARRCFLCLGFPSCSCVLALYLCPLSLPTCIFEPRWLWFIIVVGHPREDGIYKLIGGLEENRGLSCGRSHRTPIACLKCQCRNNQNSDCSLIIYRVEGAGLALWWALLVYHYLTL